MTDIHIFNYFLCLLDKVYITRNVLTSFDNFLLYGGAAIAVIGMAMIFGSPLVGIIAVIAGIGMVIKHFNRKKQIENNKIYIEKKFKTNLEKGIQIIRAILAEVIDFKMEFEEKDSGSKEVLDYLNALNPDEYIKKLGSERRIKI